MNKIFQITKKSLQFGFKKTKKHWKFFACIFAISFLIELLLGAPSDALIEYFNKNSQSLNPTVILALVSGLILLFISVLMDSWWTYGMTKETMNINQNHIPKAKNLLKIKAKTTLKFLVTTILQNLIMFASFLPLIIFVSLSILAAVGIPGLEKLAQGIIPNIQLNINFWITSLLAVLSLAFGTYISIRLGFTKLFFCDDESDQILKSLKSSWKHTKRNISKILYFYLLIFLLYFVTLVPFSLLVTIGIYGMIDNLLINILTLVFGIIFILTLIILVPTTWISYIYFYYHVIKK